MNKKKVSVLIYSLGSGGAERVASLLLVELKDTYDVTLFLMNDTIFYKIPSEIKIVYLEKSKPNESGILKLIKLPFLAFRYNILNNADISLSFMNRPNYINVLAKFFGMKSKVVISERAMPSLQHKLGIQGKINRLLIKYFYRKADIITANSRGNSYDLMKNFSCKNVVTVNNFFDLEKIEILSKERIKTLKKDEKFVFVTVGRLDSGKNHMLLINAMKNIDAILYIIGDGVLYNELTHYIRDSKLQDKIILLGTQKNPYKYISKADCFVFASNYEGFPNVIIESLACGVPVISTDCKSGPREILALNSTQSRILVDDIELCKYGILTPVQNLESMKKAMNMVMEDETLLKRYKKVTKHRANRFSKKSIIKEWFSIL